VNKKIYFEGSRQMIRTCVGLRGSSAIGVLMSFVILGLAPGFVRAETVTVKNCAVTFATTGNPVIVKIEGKSGIPCEGKVTLNGGKIASSALSMDLTQLDTGIPLRNKHLRENYLKTSQFPKADLKLVELKDLDKQYKGGASAESEFRADLTVQNVTKPIQEGKYRITGKQVTATFRMDLVDYGIERPSFMGVRVVESVLVKVKFGFE
jgi:hypothetical protein